MKKFLKDQTGFAAIAVALAVAIGALGGSVITVENPKVFKVVNEDILHNDDPNYQVQANPSPKRNR